jgi:hypothetical protein
MRRNELISRLSGVGGTVPGATAVFGSVMTYERQVLSVGDAQHSGDAKRAEVRGGEGDAKKDAQTEAPKKEEGKKKVMLLPKKRGE